MKKIIIAIVVMISMAVSVNGESLATALKNFTLNSSTGIHTSNGYYWNQTYSDSLFKAGSFTFSHTGSVVSDYKYWDGFTVSNSVDGTNYGEAGSSDGWIANQWNSFNTPTGTNGNFIVGYWGYYMLDNQHDMADGFNESYYSNWVKFDNASTPLTATVSIHPWVYYGVTVGDGFATKFTKSTDHFDLIVYAVDSSNKFVKDSNNKIKSVTLAMAQGTSLPSKMWTPIPLTTFGSGIKYLVFQMYSTDGSVDYGPNTAVYFNLSDIVIR